METIHTEHYDEQLKLAIPHFKIYPELLPHIGNKWDISPYRYLIIAESHYINSKDIIKEQLENWYSYSSCDFIIYRNDPYQLHNYINTRRNVYNAFVNINKESEKPYRHYYNMRKEFRNNLDLFKENNIVFNYLSYYNYFQRPSYNEGASIDNNEKDDIFAYNTFISLIEIIKPTKVIFVSKKYFDIYNRIRNQNNDEQLEIVKNNFAPHAGMPWWNRRSANYGKNIDTGKNRTGRERFIDIITNKI